MFEVKVNRDATENFLKAVKKANLKFELVKTITERVREDSFSPAMVKIYDIYSVEDYHFDGEPYKVLKRFDHIDGIVNTVLGEDSENNNEYLAKCKCDDCQKNITTRRFSYLLENLNNHSKIQVGKSCMKKYFPAHIKKFYDTALDGVAFDHEPTYYDTDTMLFICSSRFIDCDYDYNKYKYNFEMKSAKNDSDGFESKVSEFMEKVKNYFKNTRDNSEWVRNIKTMLNNGYFSQHHLNLFKSIVCAYKNFDKVEYTKELDKGIYTVTIKKMIKNVEADGMYGTYYKTHFITLNDEYIVVNTNNTDFYTSKEGSEVTIDVSFTSMFNGITYNFAKLTNKNINKVNNLNEVLNAL